MKTVNASVLYIQIVSYTGRQMVGHQKDLVETGRRGGKEDWWVMSNVNT